VEQRAIRPPDDITPNPNDPVAAAPGTVGPPTATPGDPHGLVIEGPDAPAGLPPRIMPSAWSGWPADWWPPAWDTGRLGDLTDTAWMCVDYNASQLAAMPPYLVNAAPSLSAGWLTNPDPELYGCWEEFAKQLFWDYQVAGEAFVIATAWYSGVPPYPARFHVVPPWMVEPEIDRAGRRVYRIGQVDVTADILHVRYTSTVGDAHGHGPLEAGRARLVAARMLTRYATTMVAGGGIPSSVLQHPEELTPEQAQLLQSQWVQARLSTIGEPAVLSGGVTWQPTQMNPKDMALLELSGFNESRIAYLLGVPAFIVGLPTNSDSMTYSNVTQLFDAYWRLGLRPKAQMVMSALSGWLLPRGTRVELNRDEFVQPEPLERAQTAQILAGIVDPVTGRPALTVDEIRAAERLDNSAPADIASGVLR
jgi:HK97 family phage portal protein